MIDLFGYGELFLRNLLNIQAQRSLGCTYRFDSHIWVILSMSWADKAFLPLSPISTMWDFHRHHCRKAVLANVTKVLPVTKFSDQFCSYLDQHTLESVGHWLLCLVILGSENNQIFGFPPTSKASSRSFYRFTLSPPNTWQLNPPELSALYYSLLYLYSLCWSFQPVSKH